MLKIDNAGNIVFWRHPELGYIIPYRRSNGACIRGGSLVCGPIQSRYHIHPLWNVTSEALPHYTWLPMARQYLQEVVENQGAGEKNFRFMFPNSYDAEVQVKELLVTDPRPNKAFLSHGVLVKRSPDCQNDEPLPLTAGLHPFFNLFNGEFELIINDKLVLDDQVIKFSKPYFLPLPEKHNTVVLRTGNRTIVMSGSGADEAVVWTDSDKHLCVELVFGRVVNRVLKKGESHHLHFGFAVNQS